MPAASSYRQDGWAVFRTDQDFKNLYDVFRRTVGVPGQVIVTGGSRTIERVAPNTGAAAKLQASYTPTGDTRGAKVVSIHTDKDGLVLVENEKEYADVADPAVLTAAVVVEVTPTHCGFTPAEVLASWESLRAWLAGAPQPTPLSMQFTCGAIVAGGIAPGPCRIDPAFVIPDADGRIRPR